MPLTTYPGYFDGIRRPRKTGNFDVKRRTAGNLTLNSTTWANVDTGLDITLSNVSVGDVVWASVSGRYQAEAVVGLLDVVSIVGGSPVKNWSEGAAEDDTHFGVTGWQMTASILGGVSGIVARPVESGDLSSGSLTLRWRYRTTTAANKVLQAAATVPLIVTAWNGG